jgi:hypothetical protein
MAVAASGLSGSTLLARMLGELPGFVAVGEVGRIWDKGLDEDVECGCGAPFSTCPFWTAVGRSAFGGWDQLDAYECRRLAAGILLAESRFPHPFALPLILAPRVASRYRRDLDAYTQLLERVYAGIREVTGADVIVDSMKIPAYIYLLAKQDRFPTTFVQLVRDPRGVAYSNTKKVPRQGSRQDKPMRTRRAPRTAAKKWLWFNLSFELLRALGYPFVRVGYEALVKNPEAAMRLCAARVGRKLSPADVRFIQRSTVQLSPGHLVAGNRMRLAHGDTELRVDDAWRRGLKLADRRTVERVGLPLFRRYGYRRDTSRRSNKP